MFPSLANVSVPVSPPYAGPLDGRSDIIYCYSCSRLLNTAYTGPSIRVRRSSDNTESDINFLASGLLDTASLLSFVGASNGHIVKLYDHSGNANYLHQTTAARQPKIVSSGSLITDLNGLPTIRFEESNQEYLFNPVNYLDPPSYTMFTVAGKRSNADYGSIIQIGFFQLIDFFYNPVAVRFNWELYDQSGGYTAGELFTSLNAAAVWFRNRVDHVAKTYTAKFKAASTTTTRTGSFAGTRSSSSNQVVIGCRNGIYYISHDFHEFIMLQADCGSTDFATLESNIESFYAI